MLAYYEANEELRGSHDSTAVEKEVATVPTTAGQVSQAAGEE